MQWVGENTQINLIADRCFRVYNKPLIQLYLYFTNVIFYNLFVLLQSDRDEEDTISMTSVSAINTYITQIKFFFKIKYYLFFCS